MVLTEKLKLKNVSLEKLLSYKLYVYEDALKVNKILGLFDLDQISSQEELQKARKKLMTMYHPDICDDPEAALMTKIINEIYETLNEAHNFRKKHKSVSRKSQERTGNSYNSSNTAWDNSDSLDEESIYDLLEPMLVKLGFSIEDIKDIKNINFDLTYNPFYDELFSYIESFVRVYMSYYYDILVNSLHLLELAILRCYFSKVFDEIKDQRINFDFKWYKIEMKKAMIDYGETFFIIMFYNYKISNKNINKELFEIRKILTKKIKVQR